MNIRAHERPCQRPRKLKTLAPNGMAADKEDSFP